MKPLSRLLPAAALLAAAAFLALPFVPPREPAGGFRLHAFSRLPVVHQGRVKPVDTFARNSLVAISGRQAFRDDAGASHPAAKWLLDVMTSPRHPDRPSLKQKVFRIENDQVLSALGLAARPGFRYSLDEFSAKMAELQRLVMGAHEKPKAQWDLFDEKATELYEKVQIYARIADGSVPHPIPPPGGGDGWTPFREAARKPGDPMAKSFGAMLAAYAAGDPAAFNAELEKYAATMAERRPADARTARFETLFNAFEPFYRSSVLYAVVLVLTCLSWLGTGEVLRRTAFSLLLLALATHTLAVLARMALQGRPPVTNLYSSAVFIGWGGVVLGAFLERLYRNGIGTLMASIVGFMTLLIAHFLARSGDTLEMMQAVLDTNFWLATHVTTIVLGYAAAFVAGGLGIVFILRGAFTRSLDEEAARTLGRMIYGIVCFATLLSFLGTVLGGIWADQSWGRFWGWDPKENAALIIVLWNAMILHARWGGLVRARGIAVLAVIGNIITAWSWFGVNMLNVGLHSYGFMGSAVFWLATFIASQAAVVALGLLPLRAWRAGLPKLPAAPGVKLT